jgi:hypothetical protein
MWAGQKMSDAAAGSLVESGGSNFNSIALFGPSAAASPNYLLRSKADGQIDLTTASVYAAPARHIIRGEAAITAGVEDILKIYINGIEVASSNGNQGTGAYVENDYHFYARAGTSLFANIREYAPPLIIFMQTADPGPSVAQIKRLQRKFAKAIGVTL